MDEKQNHRCCERALEILLKNVKEPEHLTLIQETIEDYETEFGYDMAKYKTMVEELKKGYWT